MSRAVVSRALRVRPASSLAHQSALDSSMTFASDRKTKIVCTIGPASLPKLPEMLLAGMNVARINCAHGDRAQWDEIARAVRAAEAKIREGGHVGQSLCGSRHDVAALALDIKGPEIRVGRFGASIPAGIGGKQKELPLRAGSRITLTTDTAFAAEGTVDRMFVSYPSLPAQARVGQTIYVDDGNVELRVVSINTARGELLVEALTNAPLGERKNVNLPGIEVDLPAVTKKDEADIAIAREVGADFIFASFVQSADAVRRIRALAGPDIRIISKIESQAGLDRYDEILSASDGIMVARGDLGVQIPAECVFLAQKMMIARANVVGKPIICATQMLDSMVNNPRPTRAEVVDVASAVLDGADAVMLSGETSKGAYPLESVRTMARTCVAAEAAFPSRAFFSALSEHPNVPVGIESDEAFAFHERAVKKWFDEHHRDGVQFMTMADVETIGSAAAHAAFERKAAAIIVISLSGRSAAAVAKYRPHVPVLCLVGDEKTARSLQLTRGVHTILVKEDELSGKKDHVPTMRKLAMKFVKDWGLAREGDRVVLLHGHGDDMREGVAVTIAPVT